MTHDIFLQVLISKKKEKKKTNNLLKKSYFLYKVKKTILSILFIYVGFVIIFLGIFIHVIVFIFFIFYLCS
jgi:hypothetical protein